jgi:DNA-binding transcriptional MocR family regulator
MLLTSLYLHSTILLGHIFKNCPVPGWRLGWIVAPDAIYGKADYCKTSFRFHSNNFVQYFVVHDYLMNNEIEDSYTNSFVEVYGRQCRAMVEIDGGYLPTRWVYLYPSRGGCFWWETLPGKISSMEFI